MVSSKHFTRLTLCAYYLDKFSFLPNIFLNETEHSEEERRREKKITTTTTKSMKKKNLYRLERTWTRFVIITSNNRITKLFTIDIPKIPSNFCLIAWFNEKIRRSHDELKCCFFLEFLIRKVLSEWFQQSHATNTIY